jgi:hypothetical protein
MNSDEDLSQDHSEPARQTNPTSRERGVIESGSDGDAIESGESGSAGSTDWSGVAGHRVPLGWCGRGQDAPYCEENAKPRRRKGIVPNVAFGGLFDLTLGKALPGAS